MSTLPFLLLVGAFGSGCPQTSLNLKAPQSSPKNRIRWLRTTFYQIYLKEKASSSPKDHLRLLLKSFPTLSLQTYQANMVHIESQKQKQRPISDLGRYYLLMNLLIEESLSPALDAKLESIRREVRSRFAPSSKKDEIP